MAERAAREAIAVSQEHRLAQWMAFARNSLGRALCYRGEPSEGVALQEEGMRSLHGIGSVFQTVLFRLQLAESLFELDELDRAESHLDSASKRIGAAARSRPERKSAGFPGYGREFGSSAIRRVLLVDELRHL